MNNDISVWYFVGLTKIGIRLAAGFCLIKGILPAAGALIIISEILSVAELVEKHLP